MIMDNLWIIYIISQISIYPVLFVVSVCVVLDVAYVVLAFINNIKS